MMTTALAILAALALGPYVQDVRPDGFTVAFETAEPARAVVEVEGRRVETSGTRHEARVDGLLPGRRHPYRVTIDGREVARGAAETFGDGPLTFAVFGDARSGEVAEALAREVLADSPDLILATGDLVPRGDDEQAWRALFDGLEPLLAAVPIYPAIGNHEVYGDPEGAFYRRFFVLPEDGRDRRYYSFRVGRVRFIALDGNQPDDTQTAWLRGTLEKSAREGDRHVFVFLHQPPFSVGDHCGAAPAEAAWVRLFERYRVRAVFGGHDHAYERLERNGIRYFVSGGGGAPLYPQRSSCAAYDRAARRVYLPVHHYLRVRVAGDQVEVAAIALDGGTPLETLRWSAGDRIATGPAPPLTDDRVLAARLGGAASYGIERHWLVLAASLLLLLALGGLVRRKRRG